MEPIQITFSVILTIVGSFWGYFLTRALDKRSFPKIDASRRKSINGKWAGVYLQKGSEGREELRIPIEINFDVGARKISGSMIVEDTTRFEFNLDGAFYHNKYLRLSYTSHGETEGVIDFGSLFLVLGDYPNKMAGNLSGYGSLSESLISGTVELAKHNK